MRRKHFEFWSGDHFFESKTGGLRAAREYARSLACQEKKTIEVIDTTRGKRVAVERYNTKRCARYTRTPW